MKFDYILTPSEIRDTIDHNLLSDFGSIIEIADAYEQETGERAPGDFNDAAAVLLDWICNKPYNEIMTELYGVGLLPDTRLIEYTLRINLNNGGHELIDHTFITDKQDGADMLRAWREHIATNTGDYWTLTDAEPRRIKYTAGGHGGPIQSIEYQVTALL